MTPLVRYNLHLTEKECDAVQTFVHKVRQRLPNQVVSILLFGSRARGDARPDSDMDILVIVINPDLETRRAIRDLAVEVWLTSGIYLSTRVWGENDQQQHAEIHSGFYDNLQRDAINVFTPARRPLDLNAN